MTKQKMNLVIIGKGPSADNYNPETLPSNSYVVTINEAANVFPCQAVTSNDHECINRIQKSVANKLLLITLRYPFLQYTQQNVPLQEDQKKKFKEYVALQTNFQKINIDVNEPILQIQFSSVEVALHWFCHYGLPKYKIIESVKFYGVSRPPFINENNRYSSKIITDSKNVLPYNIDRQKGQYYKLLQILKKYNIHTYSFN